MSTDAAARTPHNISGVSRTVTVSSVWSEIMDAQVTDALHLLRQTGSTSVMEQSFNPLGAELSRHAPL